MKSFLIILVLVIVTGCFSCSPVSNTARIGSESRNKEIKNSEKQIALSDNPSSIKPIDTLVIQLPDIKPEMKKVDPVVPNELKDNSNTNPVIDKQLEEAIKLCEDNKTDLARKKLTSILATINKENSMYDETKYYLIECDIMDNRLRRAKTDLLDLQKSDKVSNHIMEKVLLRIGQIFCQEKDFDSAEKYFIQLKNKFPNSMFNRLANCNFIKKH